jgi:hypothetical protein
MVITIVFAGDRVHAIGNTTEIVSMAEFGVPPVNEAIVVLDDAPDVQIVASPTPLSGIAVDCNFALTNSLSRIQNIGVWSDHIVPRNLGLINWERGFWQVPVIAQLPIKECTNILCEYRAGILEANPRHHQRG